jgi:hypothetical protein
LVVVGDLKLGGVVAKDIRGDAGIDWVFPLLAKANHDIILGKGHDGGYVAVSATAAVGWDGHGIALKLSSELF